MLGNYFKNLAEQRAEMQAIADKLKAIPNREERLEAAKKILGNMEHPPAATTAILTISQKGFGSFLKEYLKNAWEGKANVHYLGVLGFFLIPQILGYIANSIPALQLPIVIFAVPYLVFCYVATWRCSFNGPGGKWSGYFLRTFLVLLIVGLLFAFALEIRQDVIARLAMPHIQSGVP